MKLFFSKSRREQASSLLTVLVVGTIICISASSMLVLSNQSLNNASAREDWDKAFYISENALIWATQKTFETNSGVGSSNYYSTAMNSLPMTQLTSSSSNADSTVSGAWVSVVQPAGLAANIFLLTSSARVNNRVRTIQSQVTIRPASQVFDYEYFLNNWGWWWGNSITGNGGQRANWDFDFRGGPTVNGSIFAADQVDDNEIPVQQYSSPPFGGQAGANMTNMVHQGAPRVTMPNLLNFSNYNATALSNTAANGLWIGTNQIVAGVLTNTHTPNPGGNAGNLSLQTGLYVTGTPTQPIVIRGTVVIPGDLIIKGNVTGQGTLYIGGNLYIASNLNYTHGPDFTTAPESSSPTVRDAWVASNQTNDLIGYAVRGSILAGDVTDPDWIAYCYNYPGSGLAVVGDESHLGSDGIAGTTDDNTPYLHADGTTSTWYDADGDGIMEGNYNYLTDIMMTPARAASIIGYPTNILGPVAYSSIATDNMGNLDGIYYTDHAAAMRMTQSTMNLHGVIVSRNEQMIFQNYLNIEYDSRVNSRYNNNPNNIINLGLPWGKPIQVNSFTELTPNRAGL